MKPRLKHGNFDKWQNEKEGGTPEPILSLHFCHLSEWQFRISIDVSSYSDGFVQLIDVPKN
ncbi:hypothetical protein GCM10009119_34490 [Algoriphagus jejuensis]|uniref:Uncharacterized protein n=1 Tax=Algoriphagus jejuensis TaxID=419934 RepID=A0ABN1N439_9BACT